MNFNDYSSFLGEACNSIYDSLALSEWRQFIARTITNNPNKKQIYLVEPRHGHLLL